jgi:hypothetical protein
MYLGLFPANSDSIAILSAYAADSNVVGVVQDSLLPGIYSDVYYGNQWQLHDVGNYPSGATPSIANIDADKAWNFTRPKTSAIHIARRI